jgi:hypothetical protein
MKMQRKQQRMQWKGKERKWETGMNDQMGKDAHFFAGSQNHDEEAHFVRIPAHVCSMFQPGDGNMTLLQRGQSTPATLGGEEKKRKDDTGDQMRVRVGKGGDKEHERRAGNVAQIEW